MSTTTNPELSTRTEQFAGALADALRRTASGQTGSPWESEVSLRSPGAASARLSEALTVALKLQGELPGEVFLSIHERGAASLLTESDGQENEDLPEAWLRWVSASKAHLPHALEPVFGRVSVEGCRLVSSPDALTPMAAIELRGSHGAKGAVDLQASAELRANLQSLLRKTEHAINNKDVTHQEDVMETASNLHFGEDKGELHRVIDVPLAVTLRFGQRQLTLRELLALGTGSLVELDRQVEEPVDLMLGDRIVARGEVVVVDGNYGMRVTEIVECPGHRVQSGSSMGLLQSASASQGAAS